MGNMIYYKKSIKLARETQYLPLLMQCTQKLDELTAVTQPSYAVELLKESRSLSDSMHSSKVEETQHIAPPA